jgi:hypothetical protein
MRTLISTALVSFDGVVDSPRGGPAERLHSAPWTVEDLAFLEERSEAGLRRRPVTQQGAPSCEAR